MLRNNKLQEAIGHLSSHMLPFSFLPLENIECSFLCLSSCPMIKVSPGPFQANRNPLWHSAGLRSVWERSHEGTEPFREGQHVFPNVADDQPKQWNREQCSGVPSRHSEGTGHVLSWITSPVLSGASPFWPLTSAYRFQQNYVFYGFKEGIWNDLVYHRKNIKGSVVCLPDKF